MANSWNNNLLFLTATLVAIVIFALGLATAWIYLTPMPPNLNESSTWTLAKFFRGTLSPTGNEVIVRVFVVRKQSTGYDQYELFQNKIEISDNTKTYSFMWDHDQAFAAGWCEVVDVDGDGTKEFLLYENPRILRIVGYAGGKFKFDLESDELHSLDYEIGPNDFDGDGRFEFVDGDLFEGSLDWKVKSLYVPKVRHWSPESGFTDVSLQFPGYYNSIVIPTFEKKRNEEQNSELGLLYSEALTYIRENLLLQKGQ